MDNKKTFDKLPVEMIAHIFKFLKLNDRKVASTVCWSWYNASIQPRFLNEVVICLNDLNKMHDVLNIYSKSLKPFLAFRIMDFKIKVEDIIYDVEYKVVYEDNAVGSTNCFNWLDTLWPLVAPKVIYLEFCETIVRDDMLFALLNVTQQLKILKIRHVNYNRKKILFKINRLQSLEELEIQFFRPLNRDDKTKLFEIIPETLRKLCVKSIPNECEFVNKDLINVIKFCSSHLVSLELFDISQTYEIMESMLNLNMKLKKFTLYMANHMNYHRAPEVLLLLFGTQWPLVDLKLCADCITYDHVLTIADTFKDLEKLSVSRLSENAFETLAGISGSGSFTALSRLTNSINSLTKLKSLYIGVER